MPRYLPPQVQLALALAHAPLPTPPMPRSLPPQVQPALALKDSSTPRPALTYVVSGPGWSDPLPPKPKYPAPGSSASCDCCGGTTKEFHHCEGCGQERS